MKDGSDPFWHANRMEQHPTHVLYNILGYARVGPMVGHLASHSPLGDLEWPSLFRVYSNQIMAVITDFQMIRMVR